MSPARPLTPATILLADADERMRTLGARALRQLGYTVLSARDGLEATWIAASVSGRIDLLVTDVAMPRLEGPELTEELRKTRPDLKVLYISANIVDSHSIQKPYTPLALAQKVRDVLKD